MCGIAGVVRLDGADPVDPRSLERMLDTIDHRGPDGRGVSGLGTAAMGACRLEVVGLGQQGKQPMSTEDGRHHLAFNGELYDHADQRRRLEAAGERFRTTTDTEVVLRLLAREGEGALQRANGMFALAWWDAARARMTLARDRCGEKPLFIARHAGSLWFASEEKALFSVGVPASFDESTWPELLMFRYVSGERTPYVGVERVLPGHLVEVTGGRVTSRRWWSPAPPRRWAHGDAERFATLLSDSVALRMRADVPVGVLLSGGVDSSSVAALASEHAGGPLHAYTVRHPGEPDGDRLHAREAAKALGVEHHQIVVPDADTPALFETATWLRGQPVAQAASTALLVMTREARRDVTVLLSGEGADEVLGGYERYRAFRHPHAAVAAGRLLHAARPVSDRLLGRFRVEQLFAASRQPPAERLLLAGAHTFAGLDGTEGLDHRRGLVRAAIESDGHPFRQVLAYEQQTHLQSILDNSDRSTMGAGVECRVPFLDPRLLDLLSAAPPRALMPLWREKVLLRQSVAGRLPESVRRRPKHAWSAPWPRLLREVPVLRDYVRSLPGRDLLESAPLPPGAASRAVDTFLFEGRNRSFPLVWNLARVALWYDVCILGHRGVLS